MTVNQNYNLISFFPVIKFKTIFIFIVEGAKNVSELQFLPTWIIVVYAGHTIKHSTGFLWESSWMTKSAHSKYHRIEGKRFKDIYVDIVK